MILNSLIGVFVVTFLAMFFMIGELIVKLKGLGIIIGIGFITFYFIDHATSMNVIMMGFAFFVGLGLIILDGKLLNDGVFGIIGFLVVLISVAFAASTWTHAMYSMSGVILGTFSSFFLIKVLPRRDMWSKITLMDQLTSDKGYNSLNTYYKNLLNQEGETVTILRPSGTVKIDGQEYSAVSISKWIEKGKRIKVVAVDGTKIEVEEEE
ncbi:NfeD family protein [Aquisalibacillus elongatus]|uniref:NfeD-like partner-binding protein n=1 Tax=Aquisalibacillus elongatus TaxID=485577 RepID=A0A3N5C0M3_9BACI|nr:NfeD family protein [Aquisalibacillus elongatus]RPF55618.1 NfeD-like partner-binding protein [Aquisalibacillus elongatus]